MKQHKEVELVNETHYLAKDLKKIIAVIFKHYKKHNFSPKVKACNLVKVKCVYSRKNIVNCEANASNNFIKLKLPKEVQLFNRSEKLRKANHNIGILDDDSKDEGFGLESFEARVAKCIVWSLDFNLQNINREFKSINVDFLPKDIKIGEKQPQVKEKKTVDTKLIALQKLKANWERKLKRCENAIDKLDKKIKYYEKKKINV